MIIPKPHPVDGRRYYGPPRRENREDPTRCIALVPDPCATNPNGHQCTRRRGHGPKYQFCTQHATILANAAPLTQ